MYADRHHRPGLQPGSLAISLGVTGAMIAGVIFSAPELIVPKAHPNIQIIDLPLDPPPPPPDPVPTKQAPTQRTVITAPRTEVITPLIPSIPAADPTPTLPDPVGTAINAPPAPTPVATPPAPPPPLPALVGASVDPRYADALQPPYPPEERRAAHEGRVSVRVLIGVDGRVKQVERLSADSDAFFTATQRQALTHWRFRPATRGGIPVEAWRTMSVRFVLQDEG